MRHTVFLGLFIVTLTACGGGGGGGGAAPQPTPNRAPVANAQSVATDPAQDLVGTLTATDADGDALSFDVAAQPGSGTVALSGTGNRDFTYSPNAGFSGTDSFTFTASDSAATSAEATVTINVNTKPTVAGGSFETSELVAIDGSVTGNDVEGDAITYAVATQPAKGAISNFDSANGTFTYTPDPAQDGADSFTVTATDAFQTSDAATVAIDIFQWGGTLQFGTADADGATTAGLFQTANGDFVLGGFTSGQIGSTANAGLTDAWLRKIDRRGNEVWTAQFGGVDDDNSRVVLPDPDGSGTFVIMPQRNVGATVYKFDNDGLEQLNAPVDFQGIVSAAYAYVGAVDLSGNVYIVSWITPTSSLLTKVSGSNGNTLWQRALEGASDNAATPFNAEWANIRLRSIDVNAAGELLLSGFYSPEAGVSRPCATCAFVALYDTAGTLLDTTEINDFAAACGQPEEGWIYRVAVAPDDSLWAVGYGGPLTDSSFMQVAKLTADASATEWTHCDTTGSSGSFYFTYPTFASNGDGLIWGYVTAPEDPNTGLSDSAVTVLTRLAPDGSVVFRREIATTRADGTDANMVSGSVIEDGQGLLYVTGGTDGEFTPGANAGSDDIFVLRLSADGTIQ